MNLGLICSVSLGNLPSEAASPPSFAEIDSKLDFSSLRRVQRALTSLAIFHQGSTYSGEVKEVGSEVIRLIKLVKSLEVQNSDLNKAVQDLFLKNKELQKQVDAALSGEIQPKTPAILRPTSYSVTFKSIEEQRAFVQQKLDEGLKATAISQQFGISIGSIRHSIGRGLIHPKRKGSPNQQDEGNVSGTSSSSSSNSIKKGRFEEVAKDQSDAQTGVNDNEIGNLGECLSPFGISVADHFEPEVKSLENTIFDLDSDLDLGDLGFDFTNGSEADFEDVLRGYPLGDKGFDDWPS